WSMSSYNADLLKGLAEGEKVDLEELQRTADLALRATKETARAVGRSMAAMVAAERHLWLTLSDMKEKDRVFLLDAPLQPSGLFGDAVDSVVSRYQEARKQAAAFQSPDGCWASSYRQVQKLSVATRAPPSRDRDPRHSRPGVVLQSRRAQAPKRAAPTGEERVTPHYTVAVSPRCPREATGHNGLRRASAPDISARERSGTRLARQSPAGPPLQLNPEASLERLVPLVDYLAAWKLLPNVSAWVLRTVEKGYAIQFGAPPPPFDGVFPTLVGPRQALVMEQEVETLLRKEAIEVVPPHVRESGFYSRYFIVPKKDGGLRPIIDLRRLNHSVMKLKFKMLTVKQVVSQIRSEDWFVTIDLKDAYFHVSILPQHRKFLRFAFRGEAYQYRVLPFGLALSPRTFTKCVDAALVPLRLQGIRILNYIDDWLILAASESLAARHRDVVLAHMKTLGLRLNVKKSVLSPLQRTTYLGVVWDSTTMQARLSPARIVSILTAVKRVKQGLSLTVKQFQQLLGLMAAASNVIPFGLLYMRPLQWWLKSKGFSPRGNPLRMIKVTRRGLRALDMWKKPWFLNQGPTLGVPCRRVTLATDASLTGWGAVMSGRPAQGLWTGRHLGWHINCLEMLAVFRALKYFLPDLRNRHVLVRTDSTAVVYYINHQGGLRSRPLYKLAHQILVWSQDKLLSLRAVHIPGHLNVGADILSRQGPRPGEWMLHPEVVNQIWEIFGRAQLDLFATRENAQFHPAPLGLDAMVQTWPRLRLYAFPPIALLPGVLERVRRDGVSLLMVLGPDISPRRLSMGDPRGGRHPAPPSGVVEAVGVAPEGAQLIDSGLSTEVVETILQKLYALKWKLFTSWCEERQQDPANCPVGTVLEFLQARFSTGLAHSTLKVYVAAISAYHALLDGVSVGKNPLVIRFLRGVLRLRPPTRPRVPSWDLTVVLEALCKPPFEPLEEIPIRFLTIKTVLLLALTSLKRVGDLQALSVAPSHLEFSPGNIKAFLYPRPGYVPKVPTHPPQPVVLQAFCPPPFREPDQQKLNCMCPVRALDAYVHRAALWRKSEQLFVCYGPPKKGSPASKETLSRWIVDAISTAYESSDLPSPLGVKAHSTRALGASKAFSAGVPIQDICNAAGWSTPLTFVSHSWLFCPPALALSLAGFWKSGGVGISFPKRSLDAARVPEGERPGYVCNLGSPRERDAASRSILPASLLSARFIHEADAGRLRTCFYASWLMTMCNRTNEKAGRHRRVTSSTRKHKSTFCLSAERSVFVGDKSGPRFTLCVPPCKRYITSGDTHSMCVVCLGAEHALSALERTDCPHCEALPLRVLRSRKALFEEGAFTSVPQGVGPASVEAERVLHSWGSQLDLLEGMETGDPLSPSLPGRSDARSEGSEARTAATSSQGAGSSLLLSSSEDVDLESAIEEPLPQSLQYEELLEVVTRAVDKLKIDWPAEVKATPQRSKLDERFLRSKPPPPMRSLPFFPDLHSEISRSWERPFSARLFVPASDYYGNVVGLDERAYKAMPRVEQTLASYLSPSGASSLKAPTLPSKPLRTTSALVGKGYSAAGQAGACLHTMSVLQAYQADLLKGLAEGEKVDLEELQRTADLALRATKETARAVGRSMAAMVAAERHLWLTLSDMKEKDRVFLLDAPLQPSGLFGDAVDSVVSRYQEARKQAAAFQSPDGCWASSYRQVQKLSVATRAPPSRDRDPRHSRPGVVLQSRRAQAPKRAAPTGEERVTPHYTVAVSPRCPREATGHNGLRRASAPDISARERSGTRLARQSPAGPPLQLNPEASLERLVPLVDYLAAWKLLPNVSAWVLRTVEKGYAIQFGAPPPPFDGVFPTLVGPRQALVMEQEVETLLRKEAIEVVPPHVRESGFYSRYFIVPKKDGGLRPIIDLRRLNHSVMKLKFKMLTVKQVVSQIRSEDWFVTIDLKDAYFHVSILPQHRKFLRFAFRGEAYQYRVLPFGLALSPRTFTKCVDAALVPLRLQGIRILNYIDDWLILAASESLAARHRDVVLAHMKTLGLRLNVKKSVLSPLQRTTYLGVVWDSTTMQARLSPARIVSILTAVKRVKQGLSLTVKQFQQLLGLMAAASNVIPFGLLYMRPLQWWLKSKGFSPRGNPLRMIKVTRRGLRALDMWKKPWFLNQGPTLGVPCRRVTLATDASLTGWGAVMSGRPAQGLWTGRHLGWHINCLEMLAVFRALKYFLPDLRNRHVLVRTDSTAVVYYINHQGGLRSRPLYKLAHQILVWSQDKLLSLRAVHIPGHLNVGADILSRQGPRPGEWMLHPEVVNQIWEIFGRAQLDLFATRENAQFHPAPLGLDAMVQTWPRLRLYAFPPIALLPGVLERVRRDGVSLLMVLGPDISPRRLSMGDPRGGRHPAPPSGVVEAVGVAPEGAQLIDSGLSTEVVETILQKLYALKWKLFTSWCEERQQDPANCPVGTVLEFLQARFSTGLAHSTLKVYVAAISAYHALLDGVSVGKNPLVIRFLRGVLRLRPPTRPRVPSWDLTVVLEALCKPPFEPLEEIPIRFLTIKTVLLLALTSLKRVGDLQALSVAPSHLEFSPGNIKAFLYPRPGYVPKVPTHPPQPVVLQAFCPPPFREPDQQKLNCMCPVRALDAYVHRAALWRKSEQLFVCYGPPKKGSPASKETLSRWIVDAISTAYESSDLPSPLGVKAHSTRALGASKAFSAGVPIQDICNAAGWSTPLTFVSHSWLFCPPALALSLAGFWKSGGVGISFPKRSLDAARVPEGERPGYVCNLGSPRERDAASRSILPASLLSARFIHEADAGRLRTCFYASWLMTSPACDVPLSHWAFPKRSLDAASRSLGEPRLHT
ncbi:hypothetical protein M9458_018247, partial [Cirrhinus mrigala]